MIFFHGNKKNREREERCGERMENTKNIGPKKKRMTLCSEIISKRNKRKKTIIREAIHY